MADDEPTSIGELLPDAKNARRHNARNIGMIERSLQEVGAARSIVIDEDNNILAGNGTVEAAGNVDITKLRVIEATGDEIIAVRRRGLTDSQKKKLALFDNRTADLAEWEAEELARIRIEEPGMLEEMFFDNELDGILDGDEELSSGREKVATLKPYEQTHVLLSFAPDLFVRVAPFLERIQAVDGVEYEQCSN